MDKIRKAVCRWDEGTFCWLSSGCCGRNGKACREREVCAGPVEGGRERPGERGEAGVLTRSGDG